MNGNTYGRDGIYFTSDPVLTQGSDEYFDTAHTVEHVWIYQVAGNGFTGHSRSEMKLSHVTATEARGYGFVPSYDTFLTSCTAGGCWKGGFWFKDRSSIQGANLKAFYSGHNNPSSPGDAYGFLIENSAGVKLSSCEAQDNCGSGFGLVNTAGGNILAGCVADSNNKDDDAGMPAIDMWNSDDNIIDVLCHDRGANAGNQLNALRIRNTSSGNTIRIKHFTTNTGTIDRAITSDSTTYGNDITVNNLGGTREVGVVNSPYTPNPYDNGTIVMGIDGNTTINAPAAGDTHSGARMRFMIYQDGVGGHTVTFAAAYILNGGTFTAATAAGAMSVIEFMFDDDSDQWYETSRSVA